MTAIAYRDGILAADCANTVNGFTYGTVNKLVTASDGAIGAAAGAGVDCFTFNKWFASTPDYISYKPKLVYPEEFTALVAAPDRQLWLCDRGGLSPLTEPFFAIGSASDFLFGALCNGATAEQAVWLACQHAPYCAGPVMTLTLTLEMGD